MTLYALTERREECQMGTVPISYLFCPPGHVGDRVMGVYRGHDGFQTEHFKRRMLDDIAGLDPLPRKKEVQSEHPTPDTHKIRGFF
ncbi:hypothetical protein HY638_04740 [Candidatus Woesearchaeota archaeon]|nr:hypothetical protein [Candidatus Woesearchaeota archaeon]